MIYVRDLQLFIKVVNLGSFSAAGKALNLSESAVSKSIARLERYLDVKLIHRTTHTLSISDAGQEFYNGCVRGLREIEQGRAAADCLSIEMKGDIRIHSSPGAGQILVWPLILEFMNSHPDIRIEMVFGKPGLDLIEHDFDIGFRTNDLTREGSPGSPNIRRRSLRPVPYRIVASPAYLERKGRPERPEDLLDHNCLVLLSQPQSDEWSFADGDGQKLLRVTGALRSNSPLVIRDAATNGFGIARMLNFAADDLIAQGALVSLFEDRIITDQQLQLLFPNFEKLPTKIRVLIDFLVERLTVGQSG